MHSRPREGHGDRLSREPRRGDQRRPLSKLRGSIRREDAEARHIFQECVVEFFRSCGAKAITGR